MCCGDVRIILILPFVARCLETIDVCIWCILFYVCCVAAVVKDSVLSLGVLKYAVCL